MSLTKPDAAKIGRFANVQSKQPLTYSAVGASACGSPAGYNIDHNRIRLGSGEEIFRAARDALATWRQMPAQWMSIEQTPKPPQMGDTVISLAKYAGLWWLNACRVVDVRDDDQAAGGRERRYEVAYGTLPGHAEAGEERFSVVLDAESQVWYEIRAFSHPQFWLAKLAYPLARRVQRRFITDSLRQVATVVNETTRAAKASDDNTAVSSVA